MNATSHPARPYLLASDFDQTLSFHNTGFVLSELLGVSGFQEKVAGLSHIPLVQEGGELAYLLRHDPEYRCVRQAHLIEVGRRIGSRTTSIYSPDCSRRALTAIDSRSM